MYGIILAIKTRQVLQMTAGCKVARQQFHDCGSLHEVYELYVYDISHGLLWLPRKTFSSLLQQGWLQMGQRRLHMHVHHHGASGASHRGSPWAQQNKCTDGNTS